MPPPDPDTILAELESTTRLLRDSPTAALCEQRAQAIGRLMPLLGSLNREQALQLREVARQGRKVLRALAAQRAAGLENLARNAGELLLLEQLRGQLRAPSGRAVDLHG